MEFQDIKDEHLSSDEKMQFLKQYVHEVFNKYDSYDKGFLD